MSSSPIITPFLLFFLLPSLSLAAIPTYCTPTDVACWPTAAEVAALGTMLDPTAVRVLYWPGGSSPRVSAVPVNSPADQPLYGAGVGGMDPVYVSDNSSEVCFDTASYHPVSCLMAVRNNPLEGWIPGITVWPLSEEHVQIAVQFAVAHNMCIMVAGTGHDFLNRHSCPHGLFIRTALMKHKEFIPAGTSSEGYGAFRFGSGIVFSEAHNFAAANNRVVASGWASTVGVVGFSLGGGHGPFGNGYGLGVDNIVSVVLVNATGGLVEANATHHRDLFWALRGGGGSTWGVVTSITLQAHPIPEGGFTVALAIYTGLLCPNTPQPPDNFLDAYIAFTQNLSFNFSGLLFLTPQKLASPIAGCSYGWEALLKYVFLGSSTDPTFTDAMLPFTTLAQKPYYTNFTTYANFYDVVVQDLEPITPVPINYPSAFSAGGVPSVLVNRSLLNDGTVRAALQSSLSECVLSQGTRCGQQQVYQDITGNLGSSALFEISNVSISSGMRSSVFHWVAAGPYNSSDMERLFYSMGENSYFGESAYDMDDWEGRTWGKDNFDRLTTIKSLVDPHNVFWCRHCIGSNSSAKFLKK